MTKIIDINTINIGTEVFDEAGESCHIIDMKLRGSIPIIGVHQLLLFPMLEGGDSWNKDWQDKHASYIKEKIFTKPQEHIIQVQHYPSTKWYKAEVKCDKCGGLTTLTFTATTAEKLVCSHNIQVNENFYACNGKKYTEVKRRHTGIKCSSIYTWGDFIKEFKLP